jgi:hypothetical protein
VAGGRATADAELAAALPAVGCPFRARCPLASGICETVDPPLRDLSAGHSVASITRAERPTRGDAWRRHEGRDS